MGPPGSPDGNSSLLLARNPVDVTTKFAYAPSAALDVDNPNLCADLHESKGRLKSSRRRAELHE